MNMNSCCIEEVWLFLHEAPATKKEILEEARLFLDANKLDLDGYRQIWKGIFFGKAVEGII